MKREASQKPERQMWAILPSQQNQGEVELYSTLKVYCYRERSSATVLKDIFIMEKDSGALLSECHVDQGHDSAHSVLGLTAFRTRTRTRREH